MKYAIIQSGSRQYIVNEGEEVIVDRLLLKEKDDITFDKVLLYKNDAQVLIGTPYLEQIIVKGKILGELKGKKIHVMKFKAKAHYRRRIGFRPKHTKVLIETINKKDGPTIKKKKSSVTR